MSFFNENVPPEYRKAAQRVAQVVFNLVVVMTEADSTQGIDTSSLEYVSSQWTEDVDRDTLLVMLGQACGGWAATLTAFAMQANEHPVDFSLLLLRDALDQP